MTVRDLIQGAMKLNGILAAGETAGASEIADGLSSLNGMIEAWSVEGYLSPRQYREAFTLVSGQASYDYGTGGDFDSARPLRIVSAKIEKGGSEYPIRILTLQEWADVQLKDQQSTFPACLFAEDTFPLETINLWPVPSEANDLVLYTLKPLVVYATADDVVSLPPGTSRALKYNLALEMAPEYGKEPPARVISIASQSKAELKRKNIKPTKTVSDFAGVGSNRGSYNIYSGE